MMQKYLMFSGYSYFMSLDYALFQVVNDFAGSHHVLDISMILITNFGVYILALVALLLCRRKTFYTAAFSVALVFSVDFVFKLFYWENRPFVMHDVHLLILPPASASFPSRHASLAFASAISIFIENKKRGIFAVILAFLVAFSRVYVGVHYPYDVIVGILFGTAGAYFTSFISKKHFA